AIGTNPSTGTLSGTKTVAAVAGVATFAGLSIDKGAAGHRLTETGAGSTTSAAFNITAGTATQPVVSVPPTAKAARADEQPNITAGTATQLVFSVQPTNAVAGAAITPAVQITAQDASGNTATGFTGNITVAIGTNPSTGILSGTKTVAAVAGLATFSGLSIDK